MDFIIFSNDKEKYWNDEVELHFKQELFAVSMRVWGPCPKCALIEVERHSKQELFAVSMRVWNPCPKCALIRDIGFLIML